MSKQASLNTSDRVREVIGRLAEDKVENLDQIENDTPLFSARGDAAPIFDSFEAVLILIEVENVFSFQISDEDMIIDNFNSIDMIASYIEAHR